MWTPHWIKKHVVHAAIVVPVLLLVLLVWWLRVSLTMQTVLNVIASIGVLLSWWLAGLSAVLSDDPMRELSTAAQKKRRKYRWGSLVFAVVAIAGIWLSSYVQAQKDVAAQPHLLLEERHHTLRKQTPFPDGTRYVSAYVLRSSSEIGVKKPRASLTFDQKINAALAFIVGPIGAGPIGGSKNAKQVDITVSSDSMSVTWSAEYLGPDQGLWLNIMSSDSVRLIDSVISP